MSLVLVGLIVVAFHSAAENENWQNTSSLFANPDVVLDYLALCATHTQTHTVGPVLAFFPSTSKGQ